MDDTTTEPVIGQPATDLEAIVKSQRVEPPNTLYHFTSADGLCGILRERTVRLTRAVCSSDAQEVRHVVDCARIRVEVLREMDAECKTLSDTDRAVVEKLWDRLKNDYKGWYGEMSLGYSVAFDSLLPDPYIACFCTGAPGLLHWGHYGRAGEGFCLEINSTLLPEVWRKRFVRVRYGIGEELVDVSGIFNAFLPVKGQTAGIVATGPDIASLIAERIEAAVRAVSIGTKDEAFDAENEWRVTWLRGVDDQLPIRLRTVGPEFVSYVEMPLPIEAVRRIYVGSKRDVRRTAGSLAAYLHDQHAFVEIEECHIPFR